MTNESISGFLNSIVEATRALDAEPSYQSQIRDLENDKRRLGDTVAHRELRIHELKQVEETLTQKLRSVEAERDDAGFRALEEADKVQNLLVTLRGFINDGLKVLSAVEGVEQTMIAQSVLKATHDELEKVRWDNAQLESELNALKADMAKAQEQLTRPFASAAPSSNVEGTDPSSADKLTREAEAHIVEHGEGWPRQVDPTASVSDLIPQGLGQSEMIPTAASQGNPSPQAVSGNHATISSDVSLTEGQSEGPFASLKDTSSPIASTGNVTESADVSTNASPPERNRDRSTFFKGRKYFDVTYFVPLHKWLEDGGTREDYYWRPAEANVPLPEANRASHNS